MMMKSHAVGGGAAGARGAAPKCDCITTRQLKQQPQRRWQQRRRQKANDAAPAKNKNKINLIEQLLKLTSPSPFFVFDFVLVLYLQNLDGTFLVCDHKYRSSAPHPRTTGMDSARCNIM